jgi:hypothetical protein
MLSIHARRLRVVPPPGSTARLAKVSFFVDVWSLFFDHGTSFACKCLEHLNRQWFLCCDSSGCSTQRGLTEHVTLASLQKQRLRSFDVNSAPAKQARPTPWRRVMARAVCALLAAIAARSFCSAGTAVVEHIVFVFKQLTNIFGSWDKWQGPP